MVEVRGTVHWLTHADGPGRALSVNQNARARLPRILGTTGEASPWGSTDAGGGDAIQIAEIEPEAFQPATAATLTSVVDLGNGVTRLVGIAGRREARRRVCTTWQSCSLVDSVESGEVTEAGGERRRQRHRGRVVVARLGGGLAWAQPGPQPLARIRLARVEDEFTVDVTDGRFVDSDPVFTVDEAVPRMAFLSRRTFDPIYDAHSFDLSFPFGARPYLVPLAAYTLSPFGPAPGGRPVGTGENSKDSAEQSAAHCRHRRHLVARGRGPGRRGAVLRSRRRQGRPARASLPLVGRARRGHRGPRRRANRRPRRSGSTCASPRGGRPRSNT